MAQFPLHVFLAYSPLHCYTIVQLLYMLCVNNIEITVKTYICTDVFTVITTKDQSGGISIINSMVLSAIWD